MGENREFYFGCIKFEMLRIRSGGDVHRLYKRCLGWRYKIGDYQLIDGIYSHANGYGHLMGEFQISKVCYMKTQFLGPFLQCEPIIFVYVPVSINA